VFLEHGSVETCQKELSSVMDYQQKNLSLLPVRQNLPLVFHHLCLVAVVQAVYQQVEILWSIPVTKGLEFFISEQGQVMECGG